MVDILKLTSPMPCQTLVGGYSITYVVSGEAFCGNCVAEAVDTLGDGDTGQGLTYDDDDGNVITCEYCGCELSN